MIFLILKLLIITIFVFFSSKALGILFLKKTSFRTKDYFAIGYFINIALFFVIQLPVMILKLPSTIMYVCGLVYLAICIISIYKTICNKSLFSFTRKDIIAVLIAIFFLILYAYFIDFGSIETYDSYFYSVLSNGSYQVDNLSKYDPYTGLSNIQNIYKYISFYYMPSFFSILIKINYPYLILIWSFAFLNFLLLSKTALGIVRISKHNYVNNILSIFVLTFMLSFFRAPFNVLYSLLILVPIYLLILCFENVKKIKPNNILLIIIIFISCLAMSSSSLFLGISLLYIIFITMCFVSKVNDFKYLFLMSIPFLCSLILYIFESLNSWLILSYGLIFIVSTFILLHSQKVNFFLTIFGKALFIIVPVFLMLVPQINFQDTFAKIFYQKKQIESSEILDINNNETFCLGYKKINTDNKSDIKFDTNKHSTSMEYIHGDQENTISNIFITISHSILKYGGLLSFLIFGRKYNKSIYVSFIIYLITFFNPFTIKGVNLVIEGLGPRIYLFFNTFYAIYGIKYFFDFIESFFNNNKFSFFYNKTRNIFPYIYICIFMVSIISYVNMFKIKVFSDYNLIYKVPKNQVGISDFLNKELKLTQYEKKARVFYTASAFNISLVDSQPFNKIKTINSKEYMAFFKEPYEITDKIIIYDYFENIIDLNQQEVEKNCNIVKGESRICNCNINRIIESYGINYIISPILPDKLINNLSGNNEVIYKNKDYQILKVGGENE